MLEINAENISVILLLPCRWASQPILSQRESDSTHRGLFCFFKRGGGEISFLFFEEEGGGEPCRKGEDQAMSVLRGEQDDQTLPVSLSG